jgi:hypothetical protein
MDGQDDLWSLISKRTILKATNGDARGKASRGARSVCQQLVDAQEGDGHWVRDATFRAANMERHRVERAAGMIERVGAVRLLIWRNTSVAAIVR